MNLGTFFTNLSYGRLSNLSIGDEGAGSIKVTERDRITHYVNQALTLLYSRFAHNVDYVTLEQVEGLQRYKLDPLYAVSDTDVGNTNPRYILDTVAEPFSGNLIRIIGIEEEDTDEDVDTLTQKLEINERYSFDLTKGVRLLSYNTLFIQTPTAGRKLTIEYQAGHAPLSIPHDITETINLAPILHNALEAKVGQKVFSAMVSEESQVKAAMLDAEYERICQTVESENLLPHNTPTKHDRLRNKGFV